MADSVPGVPSATPRESTTRPLFTGVLTLTPDALNSSPPLLDGTTDTTSDVMPVPCAVAVLTEATPPASASPAPANASETRSAWPLMASEASCTVTAA